MTREEAIKIIGQYDVNFYYTSGEHEGEKIPANKLMEAFDMALDALEQEPSVADDGTLCITVDDYSKVGRVLVQDGNKYGGLYYPEQEPTEDLISRQDTLKAMIKALGISGEKYLLPAEKALYDIVKAMPSVQPKHGEWYKPKTTVRPFGEDTIQCSECGFLTDIDSNYNYCPKCGCSMDSRFERGEYE